jgi:magnesium transporter
MIEQHYPKHSSAKDSFGPEAAVWTYVERPSKDEIRQITGDFGVGSRFVHDALDRDEIPRVESDGTYTYIITRFAYESAPGDIQTTPILFALNHTHVVTISSERLPGLEAILPDGEHPVESKNPILIMLNILLQIDAEYDRFLHSSTKKIRHLRDRLGTHEVGPTQFIDFVHIEGDMNDFLSSLQPTNTMLEHLLTGSSNRSFADHRELVEVVILNNNQSIQTCEANLKAITSIRRTYALISAHRLDRTIKILTLASVFISIPTMFFSMYGMNVGLPWQKHRGAFESLLVLCVITVLAAYITGRKKHIF